MRIAYAITRSDAVGGASVHVRDVARAMLERGHEVLVFVGGAGPVTDQLADAGVPFRSLEFLTPAIRPACDLRAFHELKAALAEYRPGLVSTHTAKAGWLGRAACARLGLPVIYTPHGWPFGGRLPAAGAPLFRAAERIAARWTSAIVCVSEYERRLALANRIAPPEKLEVVHNGVRDVAPALRASPGCEPVRLISVARFERPKDQGTILHALARLGGPGWELEFVGDGPLEPGMRALAARLGIAERVRFLGYQRDTAPALARAQLFVLSSRSEALPRSILEAMRAGLPVIASDVGGIGEALDNGQNGVVVPPGDVEALAAAFKELLADAPRRERLGAAARLTYESRFRLELTVERTYAVYERVLTRNAGERRQS